MKLEFKPINLDLHADIALKFKQDAYLCSGDDWKHGFEDFCFGYPETLREDIIRDPQGYVHVWYQGKIIGQIEIEAKTGKKVGQLNFIYLIPEFRGKGSGAILEKYVCDHLTSIGCQYVELGVIETNASALAFYQKHGWSKKYRCQNNFCNNHQYSWLTLGKSLI